MPLRGSYNNDTDHQFQTKSTSSIPDLTVLTVREKPKRKIDLASLMLLLLSCATGVYAYGLTQYDDANALVIVPSVIAATTGALNLITTAPPR